MSGTQLSLQTFDTLVENLASAVQANSTTPVNLEDGSTILAILQADASQALWLQYTAFLVLATTRLATSSGINCDTFVGDFGLTRLPAVPATGNVTFSRYTATSTAFIPVYISATTNVAASGTQVLTADGTQTFDVIADPTNSYYVASPIKGYSIPAGTASASLPVVANAAGTAGNVLANTITLLVGGISGIDYCTNPSPTSGGLNAESDAALKLRFVNYINSREQGTIAAVRYAIQQLQQGLTDTIQENQTANGTYTPGTFVVTVDNGSGSPPSSLITEAAQAVNAIRPIGSTAIVQAPTVLTANVSMLLAVASGANLAYIEGEVSAALTSFINALSVGATLPYSRLAQVAYNADSNITNVSSVTLNSGTSDLVPTASQVVRAGTIAVS